MKMNDNYLWDIPKPNMKRISNSKHDSKVTIFCTVSSADIIISFFSSAIVKKATSSSKTLQQKIKYANYLSKKKI